MKTFPLYFTTEDISANDPSAITLYQKRSLGEKKGEKIVYAPAEALYLLEKKYAQAFDTKGKELSMGQVHHKLRRRDKNITKKYVVFKDLRNKGYILKSALKFGADFRVYDKGVKPTKGKKESIEHAKWLINTSYENEKWSWQEFAAKNRVAHSTKKKLVLAVIDEESDITYYKVEWMKP